MGRVPHLEGEVVDVQPDGAAPIWGVVLRVVLHVQATVAAERPAQGVSISAAQHAVHCQGTSKTLPVTKPGRSMLAPSYGHESIAHTQDPDAQVT